MLHFNIQFVRIDENIYFNAIAILYHAGKKNTTTIQGKIIFRSIFEVE